MTDVTSAQAAQSPGPLAGRADLAFAGSELERAAHLRADADWLTAAARDPESLILPFWRGRPLFAPQGAPATAAGQGLMPVAPGHRLLAVGAEPPVFLGLSGDRPIFARDVSDWVPDGPLPDPAAFFDASEQRHPELPEGSCFAELRGLMTMLDARAAELAATARALLSWHATHRFCSCCGAPSQAEQGGWLRRCIACKAQHFPRTDPVVIMLVTRGNRVLLGRSHPWPEGMYSCLAGFMEPGEPLESAVRREVAEETGVRVGAVEFVASQPWPYPSSLMLGCRAEALSDEITVDPVEIEAACWVTRERLATIFAGQDPEIRAPRKGAIAGWLLRQWLADRL